MRKQDSNRKKRKTREDKAKQKKKTKNAICGTNRVRRFTSLKRKKKGERERKGEGVYRKRVSCFSWISSLLEQSVVYATHIKEGVSAVSRLKRRATSIYAVSNMGFTSRSLTFVYTKIHICLHICTRFANTTRPKKKKN